MLPIEWAVYASKHKLDFVTIPIGAEYMQAGIDLLPSKHELYKLLVDDLALYINKLD